jgi:hypothetical protein
MKKTDKADVAGGGTAGSLNWKFRDGVLTVNGAGKMPDYYHRYSEGDSPPWERFGNNITSVVVEKGVTGIGNGAFYFCVYLVSAVIPKGVTRIGDDAFGYCERLTSVILPDSVTDIGLLAFGGCSCLTSIVIPEGATNIGTRAFERCESLTSIILPDSMKSIGYGAFACCSSLASIVIPPGTTDIGEEILVGCNSLRSVTIPFHAMHIVERAFDDSETWALDFTIAKFVAPRLKRFIELYGRQVTASEETVNRLHDMLFAFEYSAKEYYERREAEESERIERGLRYFAEDYDKLRW